MAVEHELPASDAPGWWLDAFEVCAFEDGRVEFSPFGLNEVRPVFCSYSCKAGKDDFKCITIKSGEHVLGVPVLIAGRICTLCGCIVLYHY